MIFVPRKFVYALALTALASVAGCGDDDNSGIGPVPPGAATILSDITSSRTFRAETTYTISGFVHVANGATLTIEPGTKIVGDYDVPGSSLFVLRGAKIVAQGTANAPIVFTSERAVGQRQPGDWGGLLIVGNGIINRASPVILEGTGTGSSNPSINYGGGSNNADDSGELQYVRVEFAGYATAADQELNSFTFAAVGSGTRLSYLQSLAGLDDSFEWFGGAVDATYLVSYESGDDHFDAAEGFQGRNQFLIAYQDTVIPPRPAAGTPSADPQGIENDGCNGANCNNAQASSPLTTPIFANFTLVGTGPGVSIGSGGGVGVMLRRGTGGYYVNGIVARWPRAAISLRDTSTQNRANNGDLIIRNLYVVENAATFQTTSSSFQFTIPEAANSIEPAQAGTTASDVFTALPLSASSAGSLDWSLKAAVAARTGGMATFSGGLATKAGAFVIPTSYRGAADPSATKWWQGWTNYAIR